MRAKKRFLHVLLLLSAALLVGQAGAAARATASIGSFSWELVDLQPNDGISPALAFTWQQSVSAALAGFVQQDIRNFGFFSTTLARASETAGEAIVSTDGSGGYVSALSRYGDGSQVGFFTRGAATPVFGGFTLTPNTEVVFRARINGAVSIGLGGVDCCDYASVSGILSARNDADPQGTYREAALNLSLDSAYSLVAEAVLDDWVTLSFSNAGTTLLTGTLAVQAYSSAISSSPVPESGTGVLMSVGVLLLGLHRSLTRTQRKT